METDEEIVDPEKEYRELVEFVYKVRDYLVMCGFDYKEATKLTVHGWHRPYSDILYTYSPNNWYSHFLEHVTDIPVHFTWNRKHSRIKHMHRWAGCFACNSIFPAKSIIEHIGDGAICPFCGEMYVVMCDRKRPLDEFTKQIHISYQFWMLEWYNGKHHNYLMPDRDWNMDKL